ncbi:MAG TPA: hypothetical protein VEK57_03810 [Thermoanaerobaculia bacterium]|nr:hypothetical protein [Thermoanaerobaculia bacterium]
MCHAQAPNIPLPYIQGERDAGHLRVAGSKTAELTGMTLEDQVPGGVRGHGTGLKFTPLAAEGRVYRSLAAVGGSPSPYGYHFQMPTFRVTFPSHFTTGHHHSYLNELSDFADWRELEPSVYLVTPLRRNTIDHVRADLLRQQDERRLVFVESDEA